MGKILILVDFTSVSQNAEEYGASLAKVTGDSIHLLHLYRDLIPVTVGPEPWSVRVSQKTMENENLIKKEVESLEEKYFVKMSGEIKRIFTSRSIIRAIRETSSKLIITGVTQQTENNISANSLMKLLKKINLPVLVVPEGVVFKSVKNIVLAVNFNDEIDSILFEPLFSIIRAFHAYLRVLHIQKKGADINPSELESKLKLGYIISKVNYLYDKVENNDVEQGIEEYVKNHPADMLVMIAQRHSIAEQISAPLLTSTIMHKINLPLLILNNSF